MLRFSVGSVLSISETKEKRKKSLWYSLWMMIFLSKKFGIVMPILGVFRIYMLKDKTTKRSWSVRLKKVYLKVCLE